MEPSWNPWEYGALTAAAALLAIWAGSAARARRRIRELEQSVAGLRQEALERRRTLEAAVERGRIVQELLPDLEQTIRELPEIAQRLLSTTEMRQIPDRALELVDEVLRPRYSVFFRAGRDELIAVAVRGASAFRVGQRIDAHQGIVAWTALKQLVVTPEDAQLESPLLRARHLQAEPCADFQLAIPVIQNEDTLGVILVGPSVRALPYSREISRIIGSLTAATIHGARLLREQETLAKKDGLTGLLNKGNIRGQLDLRLSAAEPPARQLSVFLFDIDHFKHYNDANGHLAGDDLLRALGELLNEVVREGDFVGRYGGEEFLVVLPGAGREEAVGAAERIRSRVAEHPFPHREAQPMGRVTISGGIASSPVDATDPEELLKRADEALYQAKRGGRDRVCAYAGEQLGLDDPALLEALVGGGSEETGGT